MDHIYTCTYLNKYRFECILNNIDFQGVFLFVKPLQSFTTRWQHCTSFAVVTHQLYIKFSLYPQCLFQHFNQTFSHDCVKELKNVRKWCFVACLVL